MAETKNHGMADDESQNVGILEKKWDIKKAYSETAKLVLAHSQRKSKS